MILRGWKKEEWELGEVGTRDRGKNRRLEAGGRVTERRNGGRCPGCNARAVTKCGRRGADVESRIK